MRAQVLALGRRLDMIRAQTARVVDVPVLQGDVEISHHAERSACSPGPEIAPQKRNKPIELVGVFSRCPRSRIHSDVEGFKHRNPIHRALIQPFLFTQGPAAHRLATEAPKPTFTSLQGELAEEWRTTRCSLLTLMAALVTQGFEGLSGERCPRTLVS